MTQKNTPVAPTPSAKSAPAPKAAAPESTSKAPASTPTKSAPVATQSSAVKEPVKIRPEDVKTQLIEFTISRCGQYHYNGNTVFTFIAAQTGNLFSLDSSTFIAAHRHQFSQILSLCQPGETLKINGIFYKDRFASIAGIQTSLNVVKESNVPNATEKAA